MAKTVHAVPKGYATVTPYLCVKGAADAIDFYKRAFGAEEHGRMANPAGPGIMHAELKFGDSMVFLSDEMPMGGVRSPKSAGATTVSIHLYVENVDAAFKRAVEAGATAIMPPADMFWGDRYGKLSDPFGHEWGMSTHIEDVDPADMGRRAAEFFAKMKV